MRMLDVFFQPEYGMLYEKIEKGKCETFIFQSDDGEIRHMFIKRPVPWLVNGIQYFDVTTPYGYGGPIIVAGNASPELINSYYKAWAQYCFKENIIAEFIRFHLFDNKELRNVFPGEVLYISENVIRYLNIDVDIMWMEFEHKVRKNVKKAQNNGLFVTADATGEHIDDFLNIYYETMERNEAKEFYYFDRDFFKKIIDTLSEKFMFFHVWYNDVIISTELVLCSDKYVYSFLGGTHKDYYSMRPNDLLKYEIIKWCKATNHKAFVLGGGCRENDGIYRYKKAFAPGDDVMFYVGRQVWNQDIYDNLLERRKNNSNEPLDMSFFPLYRG